MNFLRLMVSILRLDKIYKLMGTCGKGYSLSYQNSIL